MAEDTQKVAGQTEETAEEKTTEVREKVKKLAFPIADAKRSDKDGNVVSAVNADGKLLAVPKPIRDEDKNVIYVGFDPRKHMPLKKDDFASVATHLRFQAFVALFKAAVLKKLSDMKIEKAEHLEKYGDEATRKRVTKYKKMQEQHEVLKTQLIAEGVLNADGTMK